MAALFSTCCLAVFLATFTLAVSLNLVPSGDQRLCLGDSISFACSTTGDLLWETSSDSGNHVFDDAAQPSVMLGIFLLSVEHVSMTGGVNSTAMVSNVQASDNGTSLTCLEMSHTNVKSQAILKVGPPPAPTVTSITQSSTNSSSLLISWSMSDCAVQYVVTIINSSDDSVYPNITTSNTTVTLPTGVEFCVTVLGVDIINRTGPASEPQCYPPAMISATSTSSDLSAVTFASQRSLLPTSSITTSTSPTVSPVLVGGVNAAAVAVPIVLILLLVVIATVVGVVLLLIRNRGLINTLVLPVMSKPPQADNVKQLEQEGTNKDNETVEQEGTNNDKETVEQEGTNKVKETAFVGPLPVCMCQVFYLKIELNCWRIVFAFFPKDKLEKVKQYYCDAELGPFVEQLVFQFDQVEISYPVTTWWTVTNTKLSVTTAEVGQYTGEGKPPYCEMILRAAPPKENPGNLNFFATLKLGEIKFPVQIARIYKEPSSLPSADTTSSQCKTPDSSMEGQKCIELNQELDDPKFGEERHDKPETIQCVCQVLYHNEEQVTNCWRVTFAFCPRAYLDKMKGLELYQTANTGPCVDVQFMDELVCVKYTPATVTEGWKVINSQDSQQLTTAAVEQYTGEGELPCCEMTLEAADYQTSHNANLNVSLIGAKPPNNIIRITRTIELSSIDSVEPYDGDVDREYVCQVFYKWIRINVWIATFSFFPKGSFEEVRKYYYPSEYVGPTVGVQFKKNEIKLSAGKIDGWIFESFPMKVTVEQYTGVSKPPHCEITLRAVDGSTPPDLTLPVTLTGVKQPTIITLKRVAETSLTDILGEEKDTFDSTKYVCQAFYHKEGINHWKATLAFFVEDRQKNVNTVYQSEATGPSAEFQFKRSSNSSVKVDFEKAKGWNVTIIPEHNKITRATVDGYTTDKPPHCEMILRAVSDSTPPPDLTVSLKLDGGNLLKPITLERVAEHQLTETAKSQRSSDSKENTVKQCSTITETELHESQEECKDIHVKESQGKKEDTKESQGKKEDTKESQGKKEDTKESQGKKEDTKESQGKKEDTTESQGKKEDTTESQVVAAAVATAAVATVVTSGGSEKARFTKTENDVDDTGAYDDASAGDNHTKHTLPEIPGAEEQEHNSPTQYPKKPTTTTNHPNYDFLQYKVDYMGSK